MFSEYIPKKTIRKINKAILIIGFILILFAAAMGVYAAIEKISYAQAWTNLGEALHLLIKLIEDAIQKAGG